MKRPSKVVENLVNDIDAVSGKCFSYRGSFACEVALTNADFILTGLARGLEYFVAKPLYHAENLIIGRELILGWTYARR